MTHKKWSAEERVDIVVEFLSTNMGVAEVFRKHGVLPTTFDNWRRRFMTRARGSLAASAATAGAIRPRR